MRREGKDVSCGAQCCVHLIVGGGSCMQSSAAGDPDAREDDGCGITSSDGVDNSSLGNKVLVK